MDRGIIPCITGKEQIFTGVSNCNKLEGKPVTLVICGLKSEYSADSTEFNTHFQEYVNAAPDDVQKMLIIKNIVLTSSNGGDITTSDAGYGSTVPVGYNALSQVFRISGGGDCLAKQLAKFNGQKVLIFRIDDENAIYGKASEKSDKSIVFKGYEAFIIMSESLADGSNPYILNLNVYYATNYDKERKDRHAILLDNIPDGLNGVILQKGTATLTAKVVDICSTDDYTSMFGNEWDYSMFVDESGANPTTVTYDATTGLLTFAPAGSYKIENAGVLSTGNIIGIEGVNKYVPLS
ncbi:hypothetical protein IR083_20945 [Dysgonomonas sp. GY75]|uniref:hypothetical protein n=1 Tax=Dysgonomonas sp. GY75 TaxID=2780419 RepID=UPI0018832061|nr:hypothetical protein [Dysgonomonas sp. GY75]MBF0651290.1 hypothetical protein [Dysgonomonas sp. GY75]